MLLHCLNKLTKLPIGVEHLQATGIGRTINSMRKAEGAVGEEARALVNKWKEIVAAEDKSDSDAEEETSTRCEPEASIENNSDESPSHSKKEKHSKKKESLKEKSREDQSSSKGKHSSSRGKSPDRHGSKSSRSSDKHKDRKDAETSKANSKSSRKRHHSQDSNSTAEDDVEQEAPTQSFEDVLGSIETVSKKKKNKDKDKSKGEKKKSSNAAVPASVSEPLLAPSATKAPLPLPKSIDIRPSDFEISPHYKPLPIKFVADSPPSVRDKTRTAEEALSVAMAQKGSR